MIPHFFETQGQSITQLKKKRLGNVAARRKKRERERKREREKERKREREKEREQQHQKKLI